MAFQLTRLNVPNLTTDYSAETNAAAQLAKTVASLPGEWRKAAEADQKRQLLGSLGSGAPDYNKVGLGLLALGDTQGGAAVLGLGQKQQQLEGARKVSDMFSGGLLGNPAPSLTGSGASPSLIQNESGGRWNAQNNATGAGGLPGHFGRAQFGQARLQEAAAAGAIPPGTTPQQFMSSPELQQRAEQWHFGDIDQAIKQNGYDQLVGKAAIGGVPVTIEGLRAVAHLGGKDGMRKFVETQGAYNPADENGTRLSDYFARHGGGGGGGQPAPTQTAQAPAPSQAGPEGVYAAVPTPALQAFIANPKVPENLRGLMQQELERRSGGQAPVQVAQAGPQPGAPANDAASMPAPGATPVAGPATTQAAQQPGFAIPGTSLPPNDPLPHVSTRQLMGIISNPTATDGQRSIANSVLANRLKYSDENAPDKREMTRLQTEKAQLDVEKAKRESGGKQFRTLTSAERAEAGIDPTYKGVVQIDRDGQLHFPGKAGTSVEIKNEGTIPPGYRVKRDAQGQPTELEPIPGGPAAAKVEAGAEKEKLNREAKQSTGNTVLTALNDIDRLMKEATLPTTGALGSRVADIKGTAAHDIKSSLETIGANISFDRLSEMRAASPTGGALGAVTENELKLLQNSMASLQQSQSEGQFKANLGRVRANFERIVHGRTLSEQERKAEGPMTGERAKSLREEAKAAIAGGAPREEVATRLKEKYGITPEGL